MTEHAAVEIDLVGLERGLPIHLERQHLAQIVFCGGGQAERTGQDAIRRNAEHRAHRRITDRAAQALEFGALRFARQVAPDSGVFAHRIAAFAPDHDLFVAQVQQQ